MTRHKDDESAPIVSVGWLESEKYYSLNSNPLGKKQVSVAVYGMSHTHLLGKAISDCDKKFVIRDITAPGAPLSWSFAAYQLDKKRYKADVVILGLMTDNVALVTATSGATSYFDMGYPYTFPRYLIENNQLNAVYPPFYDVDGYRLSFFNPEKWKEYRRWLAKYDKYYDPILFQKTVLDRSCIFRLLRRAYAETVRRIRVSGVYTEEGFNAKSQEVIVLQKLVKEFAKSAREENSIPIIYIVNNPGRGEHLFRVLKPVLDTDKILYLSTHIICPPDNPRLFLSENDHFIPEKDIELAKEMIKIIENARKK